MDQVRLGDSGLRVSRIVLGCMSFGEPERGPHPWTLPPDEARPYLVAALEAGITTFDTANVYSAGSSEEIVGTVLGEVARREEVVIATKVHGRMGPGPNGGGLSRGAILTQVDASLRRLGTDYIDLYQIHRFDPGTPVEETMEALHDVVRAGKVRYLGASSMWTWQLAAMQHAAVLGGWTPFVSMQDQYNLLMREEEREMLPYCTATGVGVLPWSPLAGGFLSGKYRRGAKRPQGARRSNPENQFLRFDEERGFDVVEELDAIARPHGGTVAQAALRWLLAKPGVTSVVIGARDVRQLEDNLGCLRWSMTAEEVARLDALSPPPRLYPQWFIDIQHQNR